MYAIKVPIDTKSMSKEMSKKKAITAAMAPEATHAQMGLPKRGWM